MGELVLMKLGGSVITDKNKEFTARENNLRRIAREIKKALEQSKDLDLILGHGGGSFPHFPAQKYGVKEGITHQESWRGYAETRAAAAKLNRLVTEIFLKEAVNVVSFQPSASAIVRGGELISLELRPIEYLLKHHQIPVIYGDAVLDWHKGCTILSTEELFVYLSHNLNPSRIVLLGETEGVFTPNPLKDEEAMLLEEISDENIDEVYKWLTGSRGVDVTGGMLSKIATLYNLVKAQPSIEIKLVSGNKEGIVEDFLLSREVRGTLIRCS